MKPKIYAIGIDEVGRGPIAGPVAVGAFVFLQEEGRKLFRGAKESKQISEIRREEWFIVIRNAKKRGLIDYAVSFCSEEVIDRKGISFALRRALRKALVKLTRNNRIDYKCTKVLLDGGLKAPKEFKDQQTIIKGDEKKLVIALASICAKVMRDRKMVKLAIRYPKYGFEVHKGYGTKKHYEAIKKYGVLSVHRRSFLKR
jgi:ribonuclease HII